MFEILQAKARRFVQKTLGPTDIRATGLESLALAQVEGRFDEAFRAGIRFRGSATLATGIAPVQALPTTAAQWLLYNPTNNPVTAFLDKIGMVLISGTGGAGGTIVACMVPAGNIPSTIPTMAANATVRNANPASSRTSNLVIASSQTLQATSYANAWWPLANQVRTDTLVGQWGIEVGALDGEIGIAPGTALALVMISPSGTSPLFAPYFTHREYAADLE